MGIMQSKPGALDRWAFDQIMDGRRPVLENPGGRLDTGALAEAIVAAVLDWAGGDPDALAFAGELLRRTPLLEGSAR